MIKKLDTKYIQHVTTLLREYQLPYDDLDLGKHHLWGFQNNGEIVAIAGLEVAHPNGLLRSVATKNTYQGQGKAAQLVEHIIKYAKKSRLENLYLLTETAEAYFQRIGFKTISREQVPANIQQTQEFAALCPSTATVMKLELFKTIR